MNLVKCRSGHFFDSDTYEVCPTCGESVAPKIEKKDTKKPKKDPFWKKMKKEKNEKEPKEIKSKKEDKKKKLDPEVTEIVQEETEKKGEAISVPEPEDMEANDLTIVDTTASVSYFEESLTVYDEVTAEKDLMKQDGIYSKNIVLKKEPSEKENLKSEDKPIDKPSSLVEDIRQAAAKDDGKTLGFFNARVKATEETPAKKVDTQTSSKNFSEPPVGWIVCIEGNHFGETFPLKAGNNSLGRSAENDIAVDGDPGISRSKHAILTYEPKQRHFYIRPGDESGLTYLNGTFLQAISELNDRDRIGAGNSQFIFIPLCNEEFSWEEYIK